MPNETARTGLAKILIIVALVELGTGIVLVLDPAVVIRWLLGVMPPSSVIARCFGIALLALGTACWPRGPTLVQAARAMLIYNTLIAFYLTSVRTIDHHGGPLLWPAVAFHAAIAVLLVVVRRGQESRSDLARLW